MCPWKWNCVKYRQVFESADMDCALEEPDADDEDRGLSIKVLPIWFDLINQSLTKNKADVESNSVSYTWHGGIVLTI